MQAGRVGRREPILTWLAVASALLHLSFALHFVLVDHVRCADHGEWVHGAQHDHTQAAGPSLAQVEQSSGKVAFQRTSGDEGHEHEHCLVQTERRKQLALAPAVADLTPKPAAAETETRAVLRKAPRFRSARPIYAFAPKTSPPSPSV